MVIILSRLAMSFPAASFFSPVKLVGGVGEDFPPKYIALYRKHGIDLAGLQILPGKTFHWSGEYEINIYPLSEILANKNVRNTGPVIKELQVPSLIVATISPTTPDSKAAMAVIKFLQGPALEQPLKDSGMKR